MMVKIILINDLMTYFTKLYYIIVYGKTLRSKSNKTSNNQKQYEHDLTKK